MASASLGPQEGGHCVQASTTQSLTDSMLRNAAEAGHHQSLHTHTIDHSIGAMKGKIRNIQNWKSNPLSPAVSLCDLY